MHVGAARVEQARATMLELFPEGFEEVDQSGGVELAAYTDAAGEERLWHFFGSARGDDVEAGWEDRWRIFHQPARVGRLWIGPPWEDAAGRCACRRRRPRARVRDRLASDDPAVPAVPAGARAELTARRRLRLWRALDRRRAARVRPRDRHRHRRALDRGDARERARERRHGRRPTDGPTIRCRAHRPRSRTSRSRRSRQSGAASTPTCSSPPATSSPSSRCSPGTAMPRVAP